MHERQRRKIKLVVLNPATGGLPAVREFKTQVRVGGRARFGEVYFSNINPNRFSVSGPEKSRIEVTVWKGNTKDSLPFDLSAEPLNVLSNTALLCMPNGREYEIRVGV